MCLILVHQVVIAVLLEEFSKVSDAPSDENLDALFSLRTNPFEAFYEALGLCRDDHEYEKKADMVFELVAGTQGLSADARLDFETLKNGLQALKVHPPSIISRQDWQKFVERACLCDSHGTIGRNEFKLVLKSALQAHQIERLLKIMDAATGQWNSKNMREVVFALKSIMLRFDDSVCPPPVSTITRQSRKGHEDLHIHKRLKLTWQKMDQTPLQMRVMEIITTAAISSTTSYPKFRRRTVSVAKRSVMFHSKCPGSEGLESTNPHEKDDDDAYTT